ncbi:MAG: branched-chain amino acid ABC transporter permease [Betaproteobacteria bacterium]|nr:MAG: branched-chain amino acid ABC transporter permease [Betaproteobacteria bacterium]
MKPLAVAALLGILLVLPMALSDRPFELRMMVVIFLYAMLGHGWNILGGYAGQISVGHGLFFGLGAYTSTMLSLKLGLNPWFGMAAGGAAAAAAGVLVGIPCFRLKGHYFVIATLVVAESAFQLFAAWDWVGGAMGLQLPVQEQGLLNLQFHRNKVPYYYIALGMLAAVTALVWWLERSRFGYILRALRDDEEAARSLGFSPALYKLLAMALSAGIVGVGGVFFAQYVLFIDPFSVLALSFSVVIALIPILGGAGTVAGPMLGAIVLVPISEYSRVLFSGTGRNVDLLIYGFLIMLISVYRPDGLAGLFRARRERRAYVSG